MKPLRALARWRARRVLRKFYARKYPSHPGYDLQETFSVELTQAFTRGAALLQRDEERYFQEWYGEALRAEPIPVS